MLRRRQPALIASLATAAAAGLVVPAAAAGVPVGEASAASRAAAAGVVAPAVTAGAVVARAATTLANVGGEATSESTLEPVAEPVVVEEQVAAPAPEPVDQPTATPAPAEEPAGDPATEPIPTTTTPGPVDQQACEPITDPTTTTTTAAPAGEPVCVPAIPTAPPVPDQQTEPTTTSTMPGTPPASPPADTDTAPEQEPAVGPSTEPAVPTTVPAPVDQPVDQPVDGADDAGAAIPPSDDEPSDATTTEDDQPAESADGEGDGEATDTVDQPDAPVTPTPIDTTPAELNAYDPGLRASSYDGVYAEGVPVGVAMATTRWLESGNRYDAQARGSTASGAYQILDSTWNGYGGYPRAVLAPPEVQDQFAYEAFTALLKRHGNDVSSIPVSWYIGHVPQGAEWDTVPLPQAGNVLTPREYQAKWMEKFFSLLSEGAPVYLPTDTEALIPAIAFPVLGPVEFVDDWHFERDGGARRHEGLDLLGYEGQPIRAVFDGVITAIDDDPSGIAGNGLRLTRDDGLYANYFHLSNSQTGPVLSSLGVGTRVRAGQIIGFMGSTGNAGIPHLHFELRTAGREPMAPYPAVLEAVQREQCTVGLGPWSTEFRSPVEKARAATAALEAFAGLTDEQLQGLRDLAAAAAQEVEHFTIEGPDGAQWVIGTDGSVTASGQAAMIGSYQADCPMPIETTDQQGDPIMYGTGAGGLPVEELPVGWWDDEAVEWTPALDDGVDHIDAWELDQADLDVAHENHIDHAVVDDRLTTFAPAR
jgi:murein DD-endopeptidase MepM/ murein hydrolase activator NlpD